MEKKRIITEHELIVTLIAGAVLFALYLKIMFF
jgi:hypothetical protein